MDLTAARSFLEAYFPDLRDDEEIELRCIKHKHVEQLFGRDLDALLARAAALNERGYNCYFCPAIRRAGLQDGKASGISRTRWLWADLDFKDLDGDDKPGQARDTILGLRPWPQIVVASGGGLQAHYRLDADLADPTWINHFLKELAVLLGSDPAVAKAPQPMRLPGFANHKYDHKPLAHWKPLRGAADHVQLDDFDWPEPEPDPPAPARAPYDGPPTEYEQLREALAHIPPKPVGAGYEEWTRILMGIHAAFPGADGLALAQEWDPRKAREIAQKWKTFEPVGYTVGSVFWAARQHGYMRPPPRPEILTAPKGSPPGDEASRRPGATGSGVWLEDYIADPPPPVEWVVGDLLPRGGSSLIVAREKTGKSFYALNMGMAVAGGRPFLGHATTPGVVLFFSLDMPTRPLWPAINRLAPAWGVPPERFRLHDRKTDDALNAAPLERIAALVAEFRPALVIVDTLQKATGIKDPNNYSEVVETIDRLTDLAERADTHVCLLHHARKGGGDIFDATLGSVGFGGAVDTLIGLETDEEVGGLKMSLKGRWALYPPPAAIGVDDHTRQVFLIDASRDKAARQACEHQIVAYLAAHPEQKAPEREIRAALAHQETHTVTQALAALAAWARIEKAGERWALPQHARTRPGPAQLVIAGAD